MVNQRKPKIIDRRELLKFIGLASATSFSPLSWLVESVLTGHYNKAFAQQVNINPRNLLLFFSGGGRPRWAFDLFLNPQNQSGFVANPALGTKYTASGGAYTGVTYATSTVNGINAPWIWQFGVPASGGGTVPMGNLMNNMLCLQGLNSLNADHPGSIANLFSPFGSLQSLPFLVGDNSQAPISVLNTGGYLNLRSKNNRALTNVFAYSNWAQNLMDPFTRVTGGAYNANRSSLKSYLDSAALALAQDAMARRPGLVLTETDRKSAVQLLENSLGDVASYWSTALAKYQVLINSALNATIPGLNDMPIGDVTANRGLSYRWNGSAQTQKINGNDILMVPDLRTIFGAGTRVPNLPESMALSEFVLKNKLSQSLLMSPSSITPPAPFIYFPPDDHFAGVMVQTLAVSLEYRAWAACLLEIINQIKSTGAWNDTVIGWISEFGRQPRSDAGGTDHGPFASSATFYSGAIPGPMILGNIFKSTPATSIAGGSQAEFPGTWGAGDGSRDYGNLISTMSTLLRVPTPITARDSMVAEISGQIKPIIEKTSLV